MITALISWYDENPAWLAATVASARPFAAQVVALDGAYAFFPQAKRNSPTGQAEAIRETARALGMGVTVVEPRQPWIGNEVEKRSALFAVAEQLCEPDDWYFVLDGDEIVTDCPYADLAGVCADTAEDVGKVTLWNFRQHLEPHERPFSLEFTETQQIPVMFRAIRGLRVVGNHYSYQVPDGRFLWGDGRWGAQLASVADFTHVRIEHRNSSRDPFRAKQAMDYYDRRDKAGLERTPDGGG